MMIQQFHRLTAAIAALVLTASATATDITARYTTGTITREEVVYYANAVLGSTYGDCMATMETDADPKVREDAEYFVRKAVQEIAWNRRTAEIARQTGYTLPTTVTEQVRSLVDDCLAAEMCAKVSAQATTPTAAEARAMLEAHGTFRKTPETRQVAYIFKATTATASAAAKERVRAELEQVRADIVAQKVTFRMAAKQHSEAPSAMQGGHIGDVTRDARLNRKFLDIVFSLKAGEVSPVTLLHNGYYIVYVESITPPSGLDPDDPANAGRILAMARAAAVEEAVSSATAAAQAKYPQADSPQVALALAARDEGLSAPRCDMIRRLMEDRALAWGWFNEQRRKDAWPTETEINEFYTSNPDQMRDWGQWMLTRYLIPAAGQPGAPLRSREQAARIADTVRNAYLDGMTTDQLKAQFEREGLKIESTQNWVRGSDDGKADAELLKLSPGGITGIHTGEPGAYFFRLDARRTPPVLPLAEKRQYITDLLYAKKVSEAYHKAVSYTHLTLPTIYSV